MKKQQRQLFSITYCPWCYKHATITYTDGTVENCYSILGMRIKLHVALRNREVSEEDYCSLLPVGRKLLFPSLNEALKDRECPILTREIADVISVADASALPHMQSRTSRVHCPPEVLQ